jgi:hypothetical protein
MAFRVIVAWKRPSSIFSIHLFSLLFWIFLHLHAILRQLLRNQFPVTEIVPTAARKMYRC